MSHTPGPWKVHHGDFVGGGKYLWVGSGKRIEHEKFYQVHSGNPITEEQLANAHLVAAAPELLTALKQAVRALNEVPGFMVGNTDSYRIASHCDRVIAKAEGLS